MVKSFLAAHGLQVSISGKFRQSTLLVFATLSTGLIAGISSVGFHRVADRFGDFLFFWSKSHAPLARLPIVVLLPTIGLSLAGLVLQLIPESRSGGVKEVFDALERSHGVIPFVRILNVILSGLVLAFGGSVGPEGPTVQMGALVGSLIGQSAAGR